jgi:hypothetical protein
MRDALLFPNRKFQDDLADFFAALATIFPNFSTSVRVKEEHSMGFRTVKVSVLCPPTPAFRTPSEGTG